MNSQIRILFILLFTSFYINAQESGIIEGRILSADGYPLPGIAIKLGKIAKTTETNSNGEFSFNNFPTGSHTITLEGSGMKKQSKEIKVLANETNFVEFKLVEDITALKELVIKIKQSPNKKKETVLSGLSIKPMDLPQSIQIVGHHVIEQQQAVRMSDVIKNVNGVYVGSARGGAQESFWSRGYDMTTNNMFKNGFRFNSGSMPEVSSLERVEVLKGSAALLFGNVAPGGILNMVTKKPSFKSGVQLSCK
jgi:iron complex outermembrane receptor protein